VTASVRLFTRNGHDWTDRYPRIIEATLRIHDHRHVVSFARQKVIPPHHTSPRAL
jgi:hypothetical protein